jgi:C-terminal processing protease CtpA/Prc
MTTTQNTLTSKSKMSLDTLKGFIVASLIIAPIVSSSEATAKTKRLKLTPVVGVAADENMDIRTLAEARSDLKPKEYSGEERELVAKQALMMMKDLYVHRELKIKDFGAGADPVPRLEDMVKRAASMNDEEFHVAMQKIFLDLHDHHTNYIAPMPLRCSYALAPLAFADVYDGGSLKVIVKNRTRLLKDKTPETENVKAGDELVAINGVAVGKLIEERKNLSGGANDDAMVVGAIRNLSLISLAQNAVPSEDAIKYTLKRDGAEYTVDTKYFAAVNIPGCAEEAESEATRKVSFKREMLRAENPDVRIYNDLVAPEKSTPFAEEEKLPVGQFYTVKTPAGKIAKFDLETFMPEGDESADSVIHQVRIQLEKAQPDTAALIIDMRGNGGGLILLAEGLTQLFTPSHIESMPVRFLPNQLNLDTFLKANQGKENGWSQDAKDGMDSRSKYTKPRTITSKDAANRYGQVWFKPVVVLTDANCYSACDLFAAAMQDHAAATIIGTHSTTGAGGANVMSYDIFRQIFEQTEGDNPFVKLPGQQSMRVSWRQTIRVGKNKDQLIENAGVKSDVTVRYVTEDVVGGESRVLMREVHKAIDQIIPRHKSSVALASSLKQPNGKSAKWSETVKGVDTVEVVKGEQVIATYNTDVSGQTVEIQLDDMKGQWSEESLHVVGKADGKVQFRVIREVRWRGDSLNAEEELREKFKDKLAHWHTVQLAGPAGEGWQIQDKRLRVGKGPKYSPEVVTQVFATVDTAKKENILIDLAMALETEDDMDFVNIIVRDPNTGREEYAASVSGTADIKPSDKLSIPVNGAEELEIVFEFMSDENWHMKGPVISKLTLQTE